MGQIKTKRHTHTHTHTQKKNKKQRPNKLKLCCILDSVFVPTLTDSDRIF